MDTMSQDWKQWEAVFARSRYQMDTAQIAEESHEAGVKAGIAEGIAQGFSQGITQGIAEGVMQGRLQSARALYFAGLPDDLIQSCTQIGKEQLDQLKAEKIEKKKNQEE